MHIHPTVSELISMIAPAVESTCVTAAAYTNENSPRRKLNGANGMSDMEGKVTREGVSKPEGERVSISQM
jgi:hypothetical protein